jgi:vacuolar-type H+-ATPase subunit H
VARKESEDLAAQVAERVREALDEAERHADEIVADAERRAEEVLSAAEARRSELLAEAEREAERVRAETEREARERVERARAALDELGQALNAGSAAAPEEAPAEATPDVVADEPEVDGETEKDAPASEPAKAEPRPQAGASSTEELIAQLRGGEGQASGGDPDERGDAGAARLVAMNMALEGASREEVDRRLAEEFDVEDRDALLDDVFARVGR